MAITSYLGLITSEHSSQPNFMAWLSAALQMVDDGMTMTAGLPADFAIATAVGPQLDTLGQSIGASRNVGIPLSGGTSILDDTHYRILLRAKIAQNQWDGTTPAIYTLWNAIFPSSQLQILDNQNMTMQAVVTGMSDTTSLDLVTAGLIIPKPAGVGLTVIGSDPIPQQAYLGSLVSGGDIVSVATKVPDGAYVAAVLTDSPIAYYRLDPMSGTVANDSTANGNTGTIAGGVTLGQPGATADGDRSMLLDGTTGYVDISDASVDALASNADMTLEAWVYPVSWTASSSASGSGKGATVVESNEGGGTTGYCFAVDENGHIWWWPAANEDVHGSVTIPLGAWSHVVVVVSGGVSSLYVNGVLDTMGNTAGQPAGSFTRLGHQSWIGAWLDGRIDEVALYNHALSASRIQAHYAAARQ